MNRIRLTALVAVAALGGAGVVYATQSSPTSDCPKGQSLERAILSDAIKTLRVENATAKCRGDWAIAEMVAYQKGYYHKKEKTKVTLQKKDGVWQVVGDSPLTEFNAVVCQEADDTAKWLGCPSGVMTV